MRTESKQGMKTIIQPLILSFILLLLRPSHSMASPSNKTKSGCEFICGNTTIFYPFGMKDPNCYADEWFEIECHNNSKPFLKKLSLQLFNISVPPSNQVRVMSPIHFHNCESKRINPIRVNLSGSLFVFSQNDNLFVAVGCNSLALLTSGINSHTQSCECGSICDSSEGQSYNCFGRYFCTTEIPQNLKDYYIVSFQQIKGGNYVGDSCKYAFIMDEELWVEDENCGVRSIEHGGEDFIRAVMNWRIIDQAELPPNSSTNICNNSSPSGDGVGGWTCHCMEGFTGNPYLSDGCQVFFS